MIRLKHLNFWYDNPTPQSPANSNNKGLHVLENINLQISRGERVAIVGPSGCGKSTLLKIILGLIPISSANGGNCAQMVENETNSVGYIAQKPLLYPWRTLLQNAAIGLEGQGKLTNDYVEYVRDFLIKFGLKGFEDYLPLTISGGMEQRVSIIRAIITDPSVLLCDEPFSNIDYVTRLRLNAEFLNTCIGNNTTVLMVTHNIEEALYLSNRVLVFSKLPARIIAEIDANILNSNKTSPVAMRNHSRYRELFDFIWNKLSGD